ncbi:MAG: toprim domain-containing protein [Myxococcales bacterium]|nr:toprim domain-containing protein [Myxococcales bacterium]
MTSLFDALRAWPVAEVAQRLGLEVVRRGADVSFACPACSKKLRHSSGVDKRLAAKVFDDHWFCEPCGVRGDNASLVASIASGAVKPSSWREAEQLATELGLMTDPPLARQSLPEKAYPAAGELAAFRASLRAITPTSVAGRYLTSRGFDVERLPWLGMVKDGSDVAPQPWWPADRRERWPIVFGAYNAAGVLTSVHARAVARDVAAKTLWPKGCNASGLLFADVFGVDFLRARARGEAVSGLEAVVIAEGATDTLKLSQVMNAEGATFAALGYVNGSKHALARIDWPSDVPCIIAVDNDAEGDRYAGEIAAALAGRCRVFRIRAPQGRGEDGKKLGDWSDLDDGVLLDAITDTQRWEVVGHG